MYKVRAILKGKEKVGGNNAGKCHRNELCVSVSGWNYQEFGAVSQSRNMGLEGPLDFQEVVFEADDDINTFPVT